MYETLQGQVGGQAAFNGRNLGNHMNEADANRNPWQIDHGRFPYDGSAREQLAFCVQYAVLAPSIRNTQPWLFRLLDDGIELYADESRRLPATDPHSREMTISCGAALANLKLAIRHFGREAWVQYTPDPANPTLLARVRQGRSITPDHTDESLFRSVWRRRTVRTPFQPRPAPPSLQRRLIWKAMEYGCWLYVIESAEERKRVADLLADAHTERLDDPQYQRERAQWASARAWAQQPMLNGDAPVASSDGASPESAGRNMTFPVGTPPTRRAHELVASSPMLFVLGSSADSVLEWIYAGEAMQQILLQTAAENVFASFLNQACHVPRLREELRVMTGRSGPPQMILRMGYGQSVPPSPRRPIQDVMLELQ
jgi:hypothetical protein